MTLDAMMLRSAVDPNRPIGQELHDHVLQGFFVGGLEQVNVHRRRIAVPVELAVHVSYLLCFGFSQNLSTWV